MLRVVALLCYFATYNIFRKSAWAKAVAHSSNDFLVISLVMASHRIASHQLLKLCLVWFSHFHHTFNTLRRLYFNILHLSLFTLVYVYGFWLLFLFLFSFSLTTTLFTFSKNIIFATHLKFYPCGILYNCNSLTNGIITWNVNSFRNVVIVLMVFVRFLFGKTMLERRI